MKINAKRIFSSDIGQPRHTYIFFISPKTLLDNFNNIQRMQVI